MPWRWLLIHSVLRFISSVYKGSNTWWARGEGATESKAATNLCPRETTGQGASTVREVTGVCCMLGGMIGCKNA